jgi:hypothetical protein
VAEDFGGGAGVSHPLTRSEVSSLAADLRAMVEKIEGVNSIPLPRWDIGSL